MKVTITQIYKNNIEPGSQSAQNAGPTSNFREWKIQWIRIYIEHGDDYNADMLPMYLTEWNALEESERNKIIDKMKEYFEEVA